MPKNISVTRSTRVQWLLDHLNKVVTISNGSPVCTKALYFNLLKINIIISILKKTASFLLFSSIFVYFVAAFFLYLPYEFIKVSLNVFILFLCFLFSNYLLLISIICYSLVTNIIVYCILLLTSLRNFVCFPYFANLFLFHVYPPLNIIYRVTEKVFMILKCNFFNYSKRL